MSEWEWRSLKTSVLSRWLTKKNKKKRNINTCLSVISSLVQNPLDQDILVGLCWIPLITLWFYLLILEKCNELISAILIWLLVYLSQDFPIWLCPFLTISPILMFFSTSHSVVNFWVTFFHLLLVFMLMLLEFQWRPVFPAPTPSSCAVDLERTNSLTTLLKFETSDLLNKYVSTSRSFFSRLIYFSVHPGHTLLCGICRTLLTDTRGDLYCCCLTAWGSWIWVRAQPE